MSSADTHQRRISPDAFARAVAAFRRAAAGYCRGGLEAEFNICRPGSPLPGAADNDRLYAACRNAIGEAVSPEPGAHMMEIKTVRPSADVPDLIQQFFTSYKKMDALARTAGLIVTDGRGIAGRPLDELTTNLINGTDPVSGGNRHIDVKMKASDRFIGPAGRAHACGTTSIQFTHATTDADHLHRWMRIHCAMMPLYLAAFENEAVRDENGVHTGLSRRAALGERGLMNALPFTARNGEELIAGYVVQLTSLPLLLYVGPDGNLVAPEQETLFGDLPEELQTTGNLMNAAGGLWPSCKIKPVFDGSGTDAPAHLLLEVRDMDAGIRNITPLIHLFTPMTREPGHVDRMEYLLERTAKIPLTSTPMDAFAMTMDSLKQVVTAPGLKAAFGAMTVREAVDTVIFSLLKDINPKGVQTWTRFMAGR